MLTLLQLQPEGVTIAQSDTTLRLHAAEGTVQDTPRTELINFHNYNIFQHAQSRMQISNWF